MKIINGSKVLYILLKRQSLIFNTNYAPIANEHSEDIDNDENDEFLDHLFGKQKKSKENEVELYLKTPRAERKQDILLW